MKRRPVIPRNVANRDVEAAVDHYGAEGGDEVALRFVDDLERAYDRIGRHPAEGATRYAHELGLPGLRSWTLKRFPFVVFYLERDEYIDVWRVLHGRRDLPAWLVEPEGSNEPQEGVGTGGPGEGNRRH